MMAQWVVTLWWRRPLQAIRPGGLARVADIALWCRTDTLSWLLVCPGILTIQTYLCAVCAAAQRMTGALTQAGPGGTRKVLNRPNGSTTKTGQVQRKVGDAVWYLIKGTKRVKNNMPKFLPSHEGLNYIIGLLDNLVYRIKKRAKK